MPTRFRIDPASGNIAMYTVPSVSSTDDAPLTNPMGNLSRTIFHPALRYPGVVATLTGTLSLPAGTAAPNIRRATYVLGAHGQAGKPMCFGKLIGIGPGGTDVGWSGSVPVQQGDFGAGPNSQVRWLILGADDTNIVAYELCRGSASALPAMSLAYEVNILDRNLNAALPGGSGAVRFKVSSAAMVIETPNGNFSSQKRYLKGSTGSGSYIQVGGRNIEMTLYTTIGSSTYNAVVWRWTFGSGNFERKVDTVFGASGSFPAPAVSPRVQQVSL